VDCVKEFGKICTPRKNIFLKLYVENVYKEIKLSEKKKYAYKKYIPR
jgi:hypothetical protein